MCLNKWYLFLKWLCKSDFLNLSTMDIWGCIVLCCRGFVLCKFSNTPVLYPLATRSPSPQVVTIKTNLQTRPRVPSGALLSLVENICLSLMSPMSSNASKFSNLYVNLCLSVNSECFIYIKTAIAKQLQGTSRNNHRIYELEGTSEKIEDFNNSSHSSSNKIRSKVPTY